MRLDLDSLLSYNTVKVAKIRDFRLGILFYGFLIIIIFYIVGYDIIYTKRYLKTEVPTGSARLQLRQPYVGNNPVRTPAELLPYCTANSSYRNYTGAEGNFCPHVPWVSFPNYNCYYWDEQDVVFPVTERSAMLAATRVTQSVATLNCNMSMYNCSYETIENTTETFFIADIEQFTLLMDHQMIASTLGIQANAKELSGSIVGLDGKPLNYSTQYNTIGVLNATDILQLQVILAAAGLNSLDTPATSNCSESNRYAGLVVLVIINYQNTAPSFTDFDLNTITYQISAQLFQQTEFKSVEPLYLESFNTRVSRNRHGIRIIVLQVGTIGGFDFQTLLLTLVSGMGLLAVATVVVDVLAVYILPQRNIYDKYKYTYSVEGTAIREGRVQLDDEGQIKILSNPISERESLLKN